MSEKKIISLPPLRVEEWMARDLKDLASVKGVSISWLQRRAIYLLLERERDKYEALHSIFGDKPRPIKESRASQCDAIGIDDDLDGIEAGVRG